MLTTSLSCQTPYAALMSDLSVALSSDMAKSKFTIPKSVNIQSERRHRPISAERLLSFAGRGDLARQHTHLSAGNQKSLSTQCGKRCYAYQLQSATVDTATAWVSLAKSRSGERLRLLTKVDMHLKESRDTVILQTVPREILCYKTRPAAWKSACADMTLILLDFSGRKRTKNQVAESQKPLVFQGFPGLS
jgi:hypothetical protein